MTKRGKTWAGGGIAIWGAGMTAAVLVMRDANQSSQRIEAMRPAPAAYVQEPWEEPWKTFNCLGRPDVNRDGRIDLDDMLWWAHAFSNNACYGMPWNTETCPADACPCNCNCEHIVDIDDMLVIMAGFRGDEAICPPVACDLAVIRRVWTVEDGEEVELDTEIIAAAHGKDVFVRGGGDPCITELAEY